MRVPALIAFLLAPAALAADATLEDRLRALEERVRALEDENARLRAAAPAPAPASAPAPAPAPVTAAPSRPVKVGGFLQVQAEAGGRPDARFSDENDRVFLRRARVNVSGAPTPKLDWRVELDLAGTLAHSSGLRAQLTDGFMAWKPRPSLDLRGGQFKTPFGFEHLWSDTRLPFPERTLGSDRLTLGRQLGAQGGGARKDQRLSWSAGAFNGTAQNESGNDDDGFLTAARVQGVPLKWSEGQWSVGLGAHRSRDTAVAVAPELGFPRNEFAGRRHGAGLDTQVQAGPVTAWAEWLTGDFDSRSEAFSRDVRSRALMAQATWLLPSKKVELGARWDRFDPARDDRGDSIRTWTAGMQYLFRGQDLKLQAALMDSNGSDEGHETRLLIRMQVVF